MCALLWMYKEFTVAFITCVLIRYMVGIHYSVLSVVPIMSHYVCIGIPQSILHWKLIDVIIRFHIIKSTSIKGWFESYLPQFWIKCIWKQSRYVRKHSNWFWRKEISKKEIIKYSSYHRIKNLSQNKHKFYTIQKKKKSNQVQKNPIPSKLFEAIFRHQQKILDNHLKA